MEMKSAGNANGQTTNLQEISEIPKEDMGNGGVYDELSNENKNLPNVADKPGRAYLRCVLTMYIKSKSNPVSTDNWSI